MNPLIDRLLAEHRNLFRLVEWLGQNRALRAEPFAPDISLMVDALVYLTRFPDVTHHPIEDRIAECLLARNALDPEHVRELEEQHAQLTRDGLVLLSDLEGAVREESMAPDLAVASARLYAERLRHNMVFEELTLFPAAQRHLDAEDWRAIVPTADTTPPDPLFREDVEKRFVQLHQAIIAQAGCGC
ncbi:MAG: hemerythrin domain-containing protein [Burkholderiaceae bacterium]